VNEAEAATVKLIYERYLKLGSVRVLKHELDGRGITDDYDVDRRRRRA